MLYYYCCAPEARHLERAVGGGGHCQLWRNLHQGPCGACHRCSGRQTECFKPQQAVSSPHLCPQGDAAFTKRCTGAGQAAGQQQAQNHRYPPHGCSRAPMTRAGPHCAQAGGGCSPRALGTGRGAKDGQSTRTWILSECDIALLKQTLAGNLCGTGQKARATCLRTAEDLAAHNSFALPVGWSSTGRHVARGA